MIHPQYLLKRVLNTAAERFAAERSIQLHQFLLPEIPAKASKALSAVALRDHYLPDQYHCHEPKSLPETAKQLLRWLQSKECAAIVSAIVRGKVRCKETCLCVYTHRDYTVRHDLNREPPGFDVLLDLTPRWGVHACGHHSYVKDGEELVRISPAFNTLAIIHRPANVQKFVKYVNHHAGTGRRIVLEARFA